MPERTREERYDEYCEWSAGPLADRLVDAEDEAIRLRSAWTSARRRVKRERRSCARRVWWANGMWSDALRDIHRYRLAWLSARRRAVDDFNHGAEAMALRDEEITRLKARLRESTHGAPSLQCMGAQDDGSTVWRLSVVESSSAPGTGSAPESPITPV